MIKLKFIGFDGWSRAVFINPETGELYKDTSGSDLLNYSAKDIAEEIGWLHTVAGNEFDGEPDYPLNEQVEYIGFLGAYEQ